MSMAQSSADDVSSQMSTWIAAGIATGVSVLAAVGLSGDSLARVVRVFPEVVAVAGILIIFAMILGLAGATRKDPVLSILGVAVLAAGLGALVVAHAVANSAQERPTATIGIEATDAGMTAQVSISAGSLKPSQYVFVIVQGNNATKHLNEVLPGFNTANSKSIPENEYSKQRLYKGRIGPAPNGAVDASIPLSLSPGLYDQIVVQAKILDSSKSPAAQEEIIEFQRDEEGKTLPFRCDASSSDMGCGTALVPLTN